MKSQDFIPITNDIAFSNILSHNLELTRKLLEVLLQKKLKEVTLAEREKTIDSDPYTRGIRLDLYVEEVNGKVYDVELQKYNESEIPKRIRYYQSLIDIDHMMKGTLFNQVPESKIIFLCLNEDPFHRGKLYYEIKTEVVNYDNIEYEDGARAIVFNFTNERESTEYKEIEELADYLKNGVVKEGGFSDELDSYVRELNGNPKWRKEIMTLEEYINHKAEENRKKWIEEGIKQGLGQGIEIGETRARRDAVIATIRREKRKNPDVNDEELVREISLDYNVSEEVIKECLKEYLSQQRKE